MKRALQSGLAIASCVALGLTGVAGLNSAQAAPSVQSANGQGSLDGQDRHFAFNAKRAADGTVSGHVTLINKAFSGDSGHGPYRLQGDIECFVVVGNIATSGGTVRRTNDSNLTDTFYFRVQDNGEPGANNDQISRVAFFDEDETTTGDPALCENPGTAEYTQMVPIESGNIQVRMVG
jgi:hypothetical protein